MNVVTGNTAAAPTVDEQNPWLGLASFTEETRQYFYGRDEEVAELARRVQRKRLTVLFGQSGLGKTSILRAGLVPRLRGQGYCPVYVRIDYSRDSPTPAEQIKQAIARTARGSGEWTQVGVAEAGESLWEFLHHRDDVLHDEAGATLIPLLIFDQFEEIFTLGQSDDFGRARAAGFIADLSDLVENRPPQALEARLESDEAAAERFDFARSDYRVLIALREDYLAPLEGLKTSMPSITQNRLRLAPMTGQQALAAVTVPGGALVSEEVAAAIVRFVAGGSELANAEVEPSLLSLICRELNDTRLAQGRGEISLDLLDGSRSAILGGFYERALTDQPTAVRRVIEDELLTASGFRENIAEERMLASLAAAGAAPGALGVLVNRRLLRIEERLDVRRVELTHDVLCDVVKGSRDLRQEREALDATERLLADQKTRELSARSALVRARQVATVCACLALAAIVAAGYAYVSTQRAQRAERAAGDTRAAAERARSEAEHLLGYLNEDFAAELEGFGRLGLVVDLGQKELDYYRSLPPALQTSDTIRSASLAKVRFGIALQQQGKLSEAAAMLGEAVGALERLRAAGDTSEETAVGLGLGYGAEGDVSDRQGKLDSLALLVQAEATLRPYFDVPRATVATRRAYGLVALSLGSYQGEDGTDAYERARTAFASLGALDMTDVQAAADYAQTEAFECEPMWVHGRTGDVRKLAEQAIALASRVLDLRPGHLVALRSRALAWGYIGDTAREEMHLGEALAAFAKSAADAAALLRLDPTNTDDRLAADSADRRAMDVATMMGRPRAALVYSAHALETLRTNTHPTPFLGNLALYGTVARARLLFDLGENAQGSESLASADVQLARIRHDRSPNSALLRSAEGITSELKGEIALLRGDPVDARNAAALADESLAGFKSSNAAIERAVIDRRIAAALTAADADYSLGDYAAAAQAAHAAVELARGDPLFRNTQKRRESRAVTAEAMALARLGQLEDARAILTPVLKTELAFLKRNVDSQQQRLELAAALFAHALADKGEHESDLREATALVNGLSAEMRELKSTRKLAVRISEEVAGRGPAAVTATPHSGGP